MNGFSMMAAALVSAVLVLAAVFVAARRDRRRGLDEPTDMLPILDDPLTRHFDEAARSLHAYEGDFQTFAIRRLTRRLERLPRT